MDDQEKLEKLIIRLENYLAKNKKKIEEKNKALKPAVELLHVREDIVNYFKKGTFPFKGKVFKTKEEKSEEIKEETKEEFINNAIPLIKKESKDINNDLFKTYFNFSAPIDLAKKLFETEGEKNDSELVEEIKNRWSRLKDEIKKMSKEETKNEKPNDILVIISEIIDFNKEIQKQKGSDLKILTPNQMLSRLPMYLAQLKGGNNSEKLKKEIRQILYFLYRSKKLPKQFYKSLVDII